MAKAGRKSVIDRESFLKAVEKTRSLDDKILADELGVGKSTVWRYKRDNPEVVEEAEEILEKYQEKIHVSNIVDRKTFRQIPIIREWDQLLTRKMRSKQYKSRMINGLYHVCNHLNTHPQNLTLNQAVELNQKMKELYVADQPQPYGLSYTTIRESIRCFYMTVHKLSAGHLTSLGVTKEATKGQGKFSKQAVPREVRHKLEETLKDYVKDYTEYIEALGADRFMYYTGTRVGACLEFSFSECEYNLTKDYWVLEVVDKGEHAKGRLKWEKIFTDYALEDLKNYCVERFNIPYDELEAQLPHKTDLLFPTLNSKRLSKLNRRALIDAGLQYRTFPPNHIWRHTFAQDFLEATDYNFDLCCELGGWTDGGILRKHYGKMSFTAKLRAVRGSMGIELEEKKKRVLRW